MKILVMPSWYKSEQNPVKGSFFEEQARGLLKKGHQVSILCIEFIPFNSSGSTQIESYNDNGLETHILTVKAIFPRLLSLNCWYVQWRSFQFFKKFTTTMGRPDLIHAHSVFWSGLSAEYINKKTGIPFVITEHYSPFVTGDIVKQKKFKTANRVLSNAGKGLVVSQSFKKDLATKLKLSAAKLEVLPNMVAPIFLQNTTCRAIEEDEPIQFFTTAFLRKVKNTELILEAFQLFLKSGRSAKLVVGGDGPYRERLEQLSRKLGIADHVTFKGLLSREQVLAELQRCHVFLLSSFYETFGVVLIEALAAGRPVITTDAGGPRDIVTEENGIIVKSWEAENYVEAMQQLIENYDRYSSDQISRDCYKKFSEETVITRLEETYKSFF